MLTAFFDGELAVRTAFDTWFCEQIATIEAKRVHYATTLTEWSALTDRFDSMAPSAERTVVATDHEALRQRLDAMSRELEVLMRRANAYHRALLTMPTDHRAVH